MYLFLISSNVISCLKYKHKNEWKVICEMGFSEIITHELADELFAFCNSNNPTYRLLYSKVAVIYLLGFWHIWHFDFTFLLA